MQGILPEVESSTYSSSSTASSSTSVHTHNASKAFSPDCQEIPSRTTPEPIKYSSSPVYHDCSAEDLRDVPEDYTERMESVTSNVNDQLAAAQQQVNEDYTYTSSATLLGTPVWLLVHAIIQSARYVASG